MKLWQLKMFEALWSIKTKQVFGTTCDTLVNNDLYDALVCQTILDWHDV